MLDIYENLENQTKKYVNIELRAAQLDPSRKEKCLERAYGSVYFSANYLFPCYNTNLVKWWDGILDEFRKIKDV